MFHELTGYPHDSNAVQSALRLQLRQARLKRNPPGLLPQQQQQQQQEEVTAVVC